MSVPGRIIFVVDEALDFLDEIAVLLFGRFSHLERTILEIRRTTDDLSEMVRLIEPLYAMDTPTTFIAPPIKKVKVKQRSLFKGKPVYKPNLRTGRLGLHPTRNKRKSKKTK